MLIQLLLVAKLVESTLDEGTTHVFMVADVLQVLSIDVQRLLIVRVDLAELSPEGLCLLPCLIDLLS